MPAPKNPNTNAATRARRAIGDTKAVDRLREAGYVVIAPGDVDPVLLRDTIRDALIDATAFGPEHRKPVAGHALDELDRADRADRAAA